MPFTPPETFRFPPRSGMLLRAGFWFAQSGGYAAVTGMETDQ